MFYTILMFLLFALLVIHHLRMRHAFRKSFDTLYDHYRDKQVESLMYRGKYFRSLKRLDDIQRASQYMRGVGLGYGEASLLKLINSERNF